jgi:hypothetical protein
VVEANEAVNSDGKHARGALGLPRGVKSTPSRPRTRHAISVLALVSLITVSACAAPSRTSPIAGGSIEGATRLTSDSYFGHVEPDVAINPQNPLNMIAACQFETTGPTRRLGTFASFDGGHTWHDNGVLPTPLGYDFAADTTVAFDSHGTGFVAALLWQGGGGYESRVTRGGIYLWKTSDGGRDFATAAAIYNDSGFQDHPWLAVGGVQVPKLFVAWQNQAGLEFITSKEDDPFPAPRLLKPGDSPTNPVVTLGPNGLVSVFFEELEGHTIRLFVLQSTDDGLDFGPVVAIGSVDMPSLGPGAKGGALPPPLLGAASDASTGASAIAIEAFDRLDGHPVIELWQQTEVGGPWHGPVLPVGGSNSGLSQQQPRLAYAAGRLFLSYFTINKQDQIAEQLAKVSGGSSTSIASYEATPVPAQFLGDYQGLAIVADGGIAVWNQPISGRLQIVASQFSSS